MHTVTELAVRSNTVDGHALLRIPPDNAFSDPLFLARQNNAGYEALVKSSIPQELLLGLPCKSSIELSPFECIG